MNLRNLHLSGVGCAGLRLVMTLQIAICGVTGASHAAPQVPSSERAARIDALFADIGARSPGCAAGVYRAGAIDYARGYGVESLERNKAISAQTVFDVASVSKQFTAAVIVLLAQQGKLSLDDDIRKYIPELPVFSAPVTLRQMLHHTSGLRDDDTLMAFMSKDINSAERIQLDARQRALNFPPGTEWEYSNTNYFLQAQVVHRVTGRALAEVARETLFVPLGMTETSMNGDPRRVIAHRAVGYSIDAAGTPHREPIDAEEAGASGLFTSIADLARWDANFYHPIVGGPEWLSSMRSSVTLASGRRVGYGLGLDLDEVAGLEREGHGGVTNGYRAEVTRVPTKEVGVAVLCNTTRANATQLAEAIESLYLGLDESVRETPVDLSGLLANGGTFVDSETLEVIVVGVEKGHPVLSLARPGAFQVELTSVGQNVFSLGGPRQYALLPPSGTLPARLVRSGGRSLPRSYVRQELARPTAIVLREYVGRYGSEEVANDLEIERVGDHLVARPIGRSGWPLLAVVHDGFATGDLHDLRFKFERGSDGQVTQVVLMSDRVRHLVWTRKRSGNLSP